MSVLPRFLQVPPLLARPAPGHPLTQGLFSAWLPVARPAEAAARLIRNAVNPTEALERAGVSWEGWFSGLYGQQLYCSPTQGIALRTDGVRWKPLAAGGYAPVTIAYVGDPGASSIGGGNILYSLSSNAASSGLPRVSIYVNGTGGGTNIRGEVALSGSGAAVLSGRTVASRVPFLAILATRTATSHEIGFRDDRTSIAFGTSATSSGSAANEATHEMLGGSIASGGAQYRHAAGVYAAFAWDRGLSHAEMTAWLLDPFCMFRAPRWSISLGSIPVEAGVDVAMEDASLAAQVSMPINAGITAALEDASLVSGATQVGAGIIGLTEALLDDAAMAAAVTVEISAELNETAEDATLRSYAVAGSLGPFPRRPFLILN